MFLPPPTPCPPQMPDGARVTTEWPEVEEGVCGQEGLVPSSLEWGGRAGEAPGAIGGYLARMESVSQAHKSKFTLGAAFLFFHLKKKKKKVIRA